MLIFGPLMWSQHSVILTKLPPLNSFWFPGQTKHRCIVSRCFSPLTVTIGSPCGLLISLRLSAHTQQVLEVCVLPRQLHENVRDTDGEKEIHGSRVATWPEQRCSLTGTEALYAVAAALPCEKVVGAYRQHHQCRVCRRSRARASPPTGAWEVRVQCKWADWEPRVRQRQPRKAKPRWISRRAINNKLLLHDSVFKNISFLVTATRTVRLYHRHRFL